MRTTEDVKPCAHCGSDKIEENFGDESACYRCRNCGAQSGRVYFTADERETDNFDASEAEALAAWNRRAGPDEQSTDLELLASRAERAEGERDALKVENARLIEDRARFPDRPDDIGRIIGARYENLKAGAAQSDALCLQAMAQRDDYARDAERYRWMKSEVKRIPPGWATIGWDAAIDAARAATKEKT